MYKWIVIAVLAVFFFIVTGPESETYDSAHFSKGRFHNDAPDSISATQIIPKVFKMAFDYKKLMPQTPPPAAKISGEYFSSSTHGRLNVTWVSHACALIKYNDIKVITDPVFSERASFTQFFGPKRFEQIQPLEETETGPIDVVIISHNHYDHLDEKAVLSLKDRTKFFVVSLGVGKYLKHWGVDPARIIELDWGASFMTDGLTITAAPAQHMSKRGLFDRNKSFWSSFVIQPGPYKVFFSGDTGYIPDFRKLGAMYGHFDIAMLDIGAYNKAWKQNHMTPEEAVQAGIDLRANAVMPIHWGTFQLSDFVWTEPIERFTKEASLRGLRYTVPIQGEPVDPDVMLPKDRWWLTVR